MLKYSYKTGKIKKKGLFIREFRCPTYGIILVQVTICDHVLCMKLGGLKRTVG